LLKPALLLGNGFSRAYNNDIFDYRALRDAAHLSSRLAEVFDAVDTSDFEQVMRRLDEASTLAPIYGAPDRCCTAMTSDIDTVREALIETLHEHHPEGAHILDEAESENCAAFLKNFSRIYTLNYDLLLYWVIVQHLRSQFQDGFWYSTWNGPRASGQNVFYLHGALHLYDTGVAIRKLARGDESTILAGLAFRLRAHEYPLFVSEGRSEQKLSRIRSSVYLQDAYEHLEANKRPLFIYGFRFGSNDRHIVDAIARSTTPAIQVCLHSDDSRRAKERVTERGKDLALRIGARFSTRESSKLRIWR
jgi:hypothetical protein